MLCKICTFALLALMLTAKSVALAQSAKAGGGASRYSSRAPSAGGAMSVSSHASDKPIEVRGQSRNLNMLLKLQSEREAIDFIKLRKDYQKEIKEENY